MLHAVPTRNDIEDAVSSAIRTFGSVAQKATRVRLLLRAPLYHGPLPPEKALIARSEARYLIEELLPLADMPDYHGALRVLNEVRRQLGTKDPDLVALRRNLALYLDGVPER